MRCICRLVGLLYGTTKSDPDKEAKDPSEAYYTMATPTLALSPEAPDMLPRHSAQPHWHYMGERWMATPTGKKSIVKVVKGGGITQKDVYQGGKES